MNRKNLEMLFKIMEHDDEIIFLVKNEKYKAIIKKPNFDWINPCTGEFFIELKKIGG